MSSLPQDECYAKGSRGITCNDDDLASYGEQKDGLWNNNAGWICKKHHDILAKIQDRLTFEEIQLTRRAGILIRDDQRIIIPDKEWWDQVLLPSYREEVTTELPEDAKKHKTRRLPSTHRAGGKKDRKRVNTLT